MHVPPAIPAPALARICWRTDANYRRATRPTLLNIFSSLNIRSPPPPNPTLLVLDSLLFTVYATQNLPEQFDLVKLYIAHLRRQTWQYLRIDNRR